jgi:hypothetical protein
MPPSQAQLAKMKMPFEPGLEELMRRVMDEGKQSFELPGFHGLSDRIRRKVQENLDAPSSRTIVYLPELRSLLGSNNFLTSLKTLSKRLERNPELKKNVRFTCWKSGEEQDEAYKEVLRAFKTGRLDLDTAQLVIAPDNFPLFVEEIVSLTREYQLSSIQMKPKFASGVYKAAALKVTRMLQFDQIQEQEYLDFLGYSSSPRNIDPLYFDTEQSEIHSLWGEYQRMLTLLKYVKAFKLGKLPLEKAQKKLNHRDFAFFLRHVSLFSEVFVDDLADVKIVPRDESGALSPLANEALQVFRDGKASRSEVTRFLGCSDKDFMVILKEDQEKMDRENVALFFTGESSYVEIARSMGCGNMLASFVKKAKRLRSSYPSQIPDGYAPLLRQGNGSLALAQRVYTLLESGVISSDDFDCFFGTAEHPDLVSQFKESECFRSSFPKIQSLYRGDVEVSQLKKSLHCDDFPSLAKQVIRLLPYVFEQEKPPALQLNGGRTYNYPFFSALRSIERGELSTEEAATFLLTDIDAIDKSQEKYEELKLSMMFFLQFRKAELSLASLQETLEKENLKDLIDLSNQLVRLFEEELEVAPYPSVYPLPEDLQVLASAILDNVISKEAVRIFLGWDETLIQNFNSFIRNERKCEQIFSFRKNPETFHEFHEQFGHASVQGTISDAIRMCKSFPDRFDSYPAKLRKDNGDYHDAVVCCIDGLRTHEYEADEVQTFLNCTDEEIKEICNEMQALRDIETLRSLKNGQTSVGDAQRALGSDSFVSLVKRAVVLHERFPGILDKHHAPLVDKHGNLNELGITLLGNLDKGVISKEAACILLGGSAVRISNLRKKHREHAMTTSLLSWRKGRIPAEKSQTFFESDNCLSFIDQACELIKKRTSLFKKFPAVLRENNDKFFPIVDFCARAVISGRLSKRKMAFFLGHMKESVEEVLEDIQWTIKNEATTPVESSEDISRDPETLSPCNVETPKSRPPVPDSPSTPREERSNGGDLDSLEFAPLLEARAEIARLLLACQVSSVAELYEKIQRSATGVLLAWKSAEMTREQLYAFFETDNDRELISRLLEVIGENPECGVAIELSDPGQLGKKMLLSCSIAYLYAQEDISQTDAQALLGCADLRSLLMRISPFLEIIPDCIDIAQVKKKKKRIPKKRNSSPHVPRNPSNKLSRENVPATMVQATIDWDQEKISNEELQAALRVGSHNGCTKKMKKIRILFPERFEGIAERKNIGTELTRETVAEAMIKAAIDWSKKAISKEDLMKVLEVGTHRSSQGKIRKIRALFPERFSGVEVRKGGGGNNLSITPKRIDIALRYRKREINLFQAMKLLGMESKDVASGVMRRVEIHNPELFTDFVKQKGRPKAREEYNEEEQDIATKWRRVELSIKDASYFFGIAESEIAVHKHVATIARCHPEAFEDVPKRRLSSSYQYTPTDVSKILSYKKGEISAEDLCEHLQVKSKTSMNKRVKEAIELYPESFVDIPKTAPRKKNISKKRSSKPRNRNLEADFEMIRKYKSGEESAETLQAHFGLSSIGSLRSKISTLKKQHPETFEGMALRKPTAQRTYSESWVAASVEWYKGGVTSESLQELFSVSTHRGVMFRVKKIRDSHSSRFVDLPMVAPRKPKNPSEEQVQACVKYLHGKLSRSELASLLGLSKAGSVHQKICNLRIRFPDSFQDVPEKRPETLPVFQEISADQIDAAVQYRRGTMYSKQVMEILEVTTRSGMQRKIQNIVDRYSDAFVGVPEKRKKRKPLSDDQRACLIKFNAGQATREDLKTAFGIQSNNGMNNRMKSLKEFYPELFTTPTKDAS